MVYWKTDYKKGCGCFMSIPVISFIAMSSGTGKTTLLEKVIPELKSRGLRLAVIKHDAHSFEMDQPGKDTWRFAKAGADIVAISSPDKFAMIEKREKELSLDDILSRISDVDLILTEGYKSENKPKILVCRSGVVFSEENFNKFTQRPEELLAIVSDIQFKKIEAPCYDLDDYTGIAGVIIRFVQNASS